MVEENAIIQIVGTISLMDFYFTLDQQKEIQRIALLYKREAEKCYSSRAYLSGCVLMGAALEGLLLSAFNCIPELVSITEIAPRIKGNIKHFEKWSLSELLAVADELNWLPSKISSIDDWNTTNAIEGDYADIVRQVRNLIHPARYMKEMGRRKITKRYLDACFNIVKSAAECISDKLREYLILLHSESEKRNYLSTKENHDLYNRE